MRLRRQPPRRRRQKAPDPAAEKAAAKRRDTRTVLVGARSAPGAALEKASTREAAKTPAAFAAVAVWKDAVTASETAGRNP